MALKIAGKSVVGRSDPAIHRWQGGKFPIEEWVRSPVRAAWSHVTLEWDTVVETERRTMLYLLPCIGERVGSCQKIEHLH